MVNKLHKLEDPLRSAYQCRRENLTVVQLQCTIVRIHLNHVNGDLGIDLNKLESPIRNLHGHFNQKPLVQTLIRHLLTSLVKDFKPIALIFGFREAIISYFLEEYVLQTKNAFLSFVIEAIARDSQNHRYA